VRNEDIFDQSGNVPEKLLFDISLSIYDEREVEGFLVRAYSLDFAQLANTRTIV